MAQRVEIDPPIRFGQPPGLGPQLLKAAGGIGVAGEDVRGIAALHVEIDHGEAVPIGALLAIQRVDAEERGHGAAAEGQGLLTEDARAFHMRDEAAASFIAVAIRLTGIEP